MSRTLAGISLILTLLTGLVVGQFATIDSVRKAPGLTSTAASVQGAYDFYDAINEFISTGNAESLRSALHPGFVDHSLLESGPATGADLERYFDSVRLVSPGLKFSATAVLREPGVVAVTVASESPVDEEDAVQPRLDVRGSLPEFDLLKFRGSQVIERWSFPAAPALGRVVSLATLTLVQSRSLTGFTLERFTLVPSEQLDFLHESGIVILAETGVVTCESIATSQFEQMQETQEPCRKQTGGEIFVESGRSIRLRNPGLEPATLITLRLQDGMAPDASQPESSSNPQSDAAAQTIAFGPIDQQLRGPLEIVVQEVYLEPGNGMADHSVNGDVVMLATAGEVSVSGQGGVVEHFAPDGGVDTIRSPVAATPGNAFFAHHGSRFAYHNTSDAETVVLVFRIVSADASAA